MCSCPPSLSAVNARFASASVGTVSERANPWNCGRPWFRPSEAITVVSPTLNEACMILSAAPGMLTEGSGAVLVAHQHRHLGAQGLPVEVECFLTAAFEEDVRLDLRCRCRRRCRCHRL